jgi:hypothetical protein
MIMPGGFVAHPAELDGVQVPDALQVDGRTLHLNGYGLRTYSILGIHIYVASLYLEHLSTSAEEIIRSPETKLLLVRFEQQSATVTVGGQQIGTISSPQFAEAMLWTFLGRAPASPKLKQELLGGYR